MQDLKVKFLVVGLFSPVLIPAATKNGEVETQQQAEGKLNLNTLQGRSGRKSR